MSPIFPSLAPIRPGKLNGMENSDDQELPRQLAAALRAWRQRAGITQRQLADRAEVSLGAIRDIEQGRTAAPRPDSLARLASALGVAETEIGQLVAAPGSACPAGPARSGALTLAVLGPLTARRDGAGLRLGPVRQRAVLALLALHRSGLSRAAIIDVLWGDDPPAGAAGTVQGYVSRLRRLAGPASLISSDQTSYRLADNGIRCDLDEFAELISRARQSAATGQAIEACDSYERALQLWHGDPVADLELLHDHPAIAELSRQRTAVVLEYADAAVAAGQAGRATARLRDLAVREPHDERIPTRLMTALAATGQQAAALAVYADIRLRLDQDLGIRPGPELAAAQLRVLRQQTPVEPAPAGPGALPAAESARAVAPRSSLPPDTTAFTGRQDEVDQIIAAAAEATLVGGVVAINGMPGVGKTALAVHVAHLLRDRFPDWQLFIDLRAHTTSQDPLTPQAALAALLTATGVQGRFLPEDLDGRTARWRDRMAGQRALVVLDNAASSMQVIPLLPGTEGCLVLISSRRHLADLPGAVVPISLPTLAAPQASEMFARLAPRSAAASAGAIDELTALTGCLPLAVCLLARVYNRHPSWTLAELAAETKAHLLTLTAENDSIAAAFEVSWQHLSGRQREFFSGLSLHPGSVIDPYAAAALAGRPLAQASRLLDELHQEGLLTEVSYHRYGMHDLIRRYAADRATAGPAADRELALGRLFDYYQHTAALAGSLASSGTDEGHGLPGPAGPPLAVPELPDTAGALAWARAERANLLACLDLAGRSGQRARLVALTAAVAALLRHDGPWTDASTRHCAAADAAAALGDRPGQARALHNLGVTRRLTGDYAGAAEALEEADDLLSDLGDRLGQAGVLRELGVVRYSTADNLAALGLLERALELSRDLDDRPGQASALNYLGDAFRMADDYRSAAWVLAEALSIFHDLGDRAGQARVLNYLGSVLRVTGDVAGSAAVLVDALGIYRDIGEQAGQASVLLNLGAVRLVTGEHQEAARALGDALAMYRELGSRHGCALGLRYLGSVRRATGDSAAAASLLAQALEMFREVGDRQGQAEVLNETGALQLADGAIGPAETSHRQALQLARQAGGQWDEAHALAGLGHCALAMGDTARAASCMRQAREIFERIGAAEAAETRV
jgi:DNA-binding SARP family transcriptional activator/tetratricopeptide (TPR) repeat protein/DNA-binding XRE family transcriptional regulator